MTTEQIIDEMNKVDITKLDALELKAFGDACFERSGECINEEQKRENELDGSDED